MPDVHYERSGHGGPLNAGMRADKRTKWRRHIQRVQWQTMRLMDYRRWNHVFEQIVNANPRLRPGVPVLAYFRKIYAEAQTMAIRRQAKPHDDAIGLLDLIEDIAKYPSVITLDWTIQLYSEPLPSGQQYDPVLAAELARSAFRTL